MRILLISPMLPEIGGVSISTGRLKDRLVADGHQVQVFSMSYKNPSFNNKWLRMIRFLLAPFFVLFQPRYEIIHCHVSGIFRMRYLLLFKRFYHGAKLIFTVHRDVGRVFKGRVSKDFCKADCLICVQPGDANRLKQKLSNVKAVDIPAFILPTNIDESAVPHDVLSFVKFSSEPVIIVTGSIVLDGNFYDLYGLQDAINLYKTLKSNGLQLKLLVIITGNVMSQQQASFFNSMTALVTNDENVMITSLIKMPLMPLFKYAKIFLRPTKTDGDALSVREALAMKCSVLASDVSVRPEGSITYHNEDECVDKATRILRDKLASSFATVEFYNEIVQLYDRVLKG